LKKTLDRVSQFSVIARDENVGKDENVGSLMLTGYIRMTNTCSQSHVKKMLGKFSSCVPTILGDVVNLLKFYSIDKYITVTGRLPSRGDVNDGKLGYSAEWVLKTINEKS
jgi:hypothetical protein